MVLAMESSVRSCKLIIFPFCSIKVLFSLSSFWHCLYFYSSLRLFLFSLKAFSFVDLLYFLCFSRMVMASTIVLGVNFFHLVKNKDDHRRLFQDAALFFFHRVWLRVM